MPAPPWACADTPTSAHGRPTPGALRPGCGTAARPAPGEPLLVPDTPGLPTQVVDVRDEAAWILDGAERGTTGAYDVVGPVVPFGEWGRMQA